MKTRYPLLNLVRSATTIGLAASFIVPALPSSSRAQDAAPDRPAEVIRFATFNAALSGQTADDLPGRLATPDDEKLKKIAAIIQQVRPDVLLINEFDFNPTGQLAADFQQHYLSIAQDDAEPISFPHRFFPDVNTGLATGIDLNGDGQVGGPADAHGWGDFPGQYGMLLLSRIPIKHQNFPTAKNVLWSKFPDTLYPASHFPPEAAGVLRLSSKNHAFVPLQLPNLPPIGVLISHPTPPVFDGPEDRNGRRNFDEIKLLKIIVDGDETPLVILGDLNADPNDGESIPGAINQLLDHPRIQDPQPRSRGAVEKSLADGGINAEHLTDPALDTADWGDQPPHGSGNLRVDYVLPTKDWTVVDAGVFWPTPDEPGHDWIDASDHRLVWVDLTLDTPQKNSD